MAVKQGWVIHHDQATDPIYTKDFTHDGRCAEFWHGVYVWHTQHNGWSDIAYSFGICRHGVRFEGRGFNKNQFAGGEDQKATSYHDTEWYSVLAFLGDGEVPTPEMLDGIEALRLESVQRGQAGLRVIGHNFFRKKECPGPILTAFAATLDGTDPEFMALSDDDVKRIADAVWAHTVHSAKDGDQPAATQLGWIKDEIDNPENLSRRTANLVTPSSAGGASASAVADELAHRLES